MDVDGPSGAGPSTRQAVFGASVDDIWCAVPAHAWLCSQLGICMLCVLGMCIQGAFVQQHLTLPFCAVPNQNCYTAGDYGSLRKSLSSCGIRKASDKGVCWASMGYLSLTAGSCLLAGTILWPRSLAWIPARDAEGSATRRSGSEISWHLATAGPTVTALLQWEQPHLPSELLADA